MPYSAFSIDKCFAFRLGFVSLVLFFNFPTTFAQPPIFRIQSYVETYSLEAVHQMVNYKIPASVIMAQAIFESQSGSSELAKKSNNHFGIKCHVEWGGDTILKDDDTLNECFRKYTNIEDSYTDHSLFLNSRSRYSSLFELPVSDYKSWCVGLKASGYATYPAYADELIRIIEQIKLYELDGYENLKNLGIGAFLKERELMVSTLTPANFPLNDFYQAGILWEDERELLVQSLNFILESDEVNHSEME